MEKVSKFTKALVKGVQSGDCLLLSGKIPKTETSLRNLPSIFQVFRPLTAATLKNPKRTPMPGKVGTSFERNSQER